MNGRYYTISTRGVSVSAAQDLLEHLVAADQVVGLISAKFTQSSDAGDSESEQLDISIRRVTGAPTSGSGGSTPTAQPTVDGGVAASGTTECNNTTQLSGGTNVVLVTEAFNVMAGWQYIPAPEERLFFGGQTRLLIELETAPADAVTGNFTCTIVELG